MRVLVASGTSMSNPNGHAGCREADCRVHHDVASPPELIFTEMWPGGSCPDPVTNPLAPSVAGEIQLSTYTCHFGRGDRRGAVAPTRANESRQLSNLFVAIPPAECRHRQTTWRPRGSRAAAAAQDHRDQGRRTPTQHAWIVGKSRKGRRFTASREAMAGGAAIHEKPPGGFLVSRDDGAHCRIASGKGRPPLAGSGRQRFETGRDRGEILSGHVLRAVNDYISHRTGASRMAVALGYCPSLSHASPA
jgi:hypothetical protein